MLLGLNGKVVVVTGGTKGIGRRIVEAFISEGSQVHFCARNEEEVRNSELDLRSGHTEWGPKSVHGKVLDVSDHESLSAWIDKIASENGKIDVIVSNVSAIGIKNTPDAWAASFNIDMMATVTLVNSALPHLEQSHGNIIAISSVTGRDIDFSATSPYGAIKAGLIHYISQLAHTLAPKGVRANTVSPGNIYFKGGVWEILEKANPEFFKKQLESNPLGRMGKPEEIANAVLFLASEKASFVTGANFLVDGALSTGVQF